MSCHGYEGVPSTLQVKCYPIVCNKCNTHSDYRDELSRSFAADNVKHTIQKEKKDEKKSTQSCHYF